MPDSGNNRTTAASTLPLLPPKDTESALPAGTRLGEFEIIDLIGVGGFGIVYLAIDRSLGRRVALKEYMPSSLASRGEGAFVNVRSERYIATFEAGRRSFVNEARLLAQFDHPALVKVYQFWEANGTAYMVMPYYAGITLKQALKNMSHAPDEEWLKHLVMPILDALDVIHAAHVFHRDIAPDNILLLEGDRPLVLDFGAARRVISNMTQALTVILKPGYAPIEQYAQIADMAQGAWTDIYALAAVLYMAIIGRTPPAAVSRIMNDTMEPIAQQAAGRYSRSFLHAIDLGLSVQPKDRPQSVQDFRELMGIDTTFAPALPLPTILMRPDPPPPRSPAVEGTSKAAFFATATLAIGVSAVSTYLWVHESPPHQPSPPAATQTAVVPAVQEISAAPPIQKPFSALDEMDRIFRDRDRDHSVMVEVDKAQVRIGRDRLNFRVRSSRAGYLYILMIGTDNRHFYRLFPNAVDARNKMEPGKDLSLPRRGWSMIAGGPAGSNHFIAIVSRSPRDFSDTGLTSVDPFAEFPLDAAAALVAKEGRAQSPFLGTTICPDTDSACPDNYGAAVFTIDEIN